MKGGFAYEKWRHGGWYWFAPEAIRWPNGGCGCVSRNYPDGKWRIVCDPRPGDHTYKTRGEAASAELELMREARS